MTTFKEGGFSGLNKSIQSNEQLILKGTYSMFEESNGKNRTKTNGLPDNFKDLKILLEYKNSYKKSFHTIFTNTGEENKYLRGKPKISISNNNK